MSRLVYSAWKIWLHPRITRRAMTELEQACQNSGSNRAAQIEALELQLETSRSQLENTREELAGMREELERTRYELQEARTELAARADTEAQLREFGDILAAAEEMKAHYESRIQLLRNRIIEMKKNRTPIGARNMGSGLIDMLETAPQSAAQQGPQSQNPLQQNPGAKNSVEHGAGAQNSEGGDSVSEEEGDWLEELPDMG